MIKGNASTVLTKNAAVPVRMALENAFQARSSLMNGWYHPPFLTACSFGSGEEDGEESFDDSDARRKLEEYQGSTAAAASASKDRGNNRDGPSDSDDNGAPQDEQRQAVEAAAEAAAAAGMSGFLQNGQVSWIRS